MKKKFQLNGIKLFVVRYPYTSTQKELIEMKQELTEILPALRKFAFSLTGNMHDADDLTQTTIEKLLSKSIPEDVAVLAWAFRVCRNAWIDEFRAAKTRVNATEKPELQQLESDEGDMELHNKITLKQVTSSMGKLPLEQRETLALVAVQGMSYADASQILSVPVGTIMSRLARARTKLSHILNLSLEAG